MLATPLTGLMRLRELCGDLEREERALQTAFVGSEDLMAVLDSEGFVVQLNQSWYKIFGWGTERCNTPFIDLVFEPDQADFQSELADASPMTCRVRHRDSSYRLVEFTMNCWCEGYHNLVGHLVHSNAIDTRKTGC